MSTNDKQSFEVAVTNCKKVTEQISAFYLNQKLSDIVIEVGEERLPAHKVILAARLPSFDTLFSDTKESLEVSFPDFSSETVKNFLKYVYTGSVHFFVSKNDSKLELLSLASVLLFPELEDAVTTKLISIINVDNVCLFLNLADFHNLENLQEVCLNFSDIHCSEILSSDCFNSLSEVSLTKLLQRDSFLAPELKIFKSVAEWCHVNRKVNRNSVLKHLRLACLSVDDVLETVGSSQLFTNEYLLNVIAEIKHDKPIQTVCRQQEIKLRSSQEVVPGTRFAEHIGKNGITIILKNLQLINYIHARLYDADDRGYSYYIEISTDQKKWKRVVDYTKYRCRSYQHLYFEEEQAKYIRFVGTADGYKNFHLLFAEIFYNSHVPNLVDGVILPTENVATVDKGALVIKGENPDALLDGDDENYNNYTWHKKGSSIVIRLAQPYVISTMKFKLWDRDDRRYKYYISTSTDNVNWETVVDKRNTITKSWEHVSFPEKIVVYIQITGTFNSHNEDFHLMHFECPDEDAKYWRNW